MFFVLLSSRMHTKNAKQNDDADLSLFPLNIIILKYVAHIYTHTWNTHMIKHILYESNKLAKKSKSYYITAICCLVFFFKGR